LNRYRIVPQALQRPVLFRKSEKILECMQMDRQKKKKKKNSKQTMSVELAGQRFERFQELRSAVHNMLFHNEVGTKLSEADAKLIEELVQKGHKDPPSKLGDGLEAVEVGMHPEFNDSRCLMLVRKDGSRVDFSYVKCVRALFAGQMEAASRKKPIERVAGTVIRFSVDSSLVPDVPGVTRKRSALGDDSDDGNESNKRQRTATGSVETQQQANDGDNAVQDDEKAKEDVVDDKEEEKETSASSAAASVVVDYRDIVDARNRAKEVIRSLFTVRYLPAVLDTDQDDFSQGYARFESADVAEQCAEAAANKEIAVNAVLLAGDELEAYFDRVESTQQRASEKKSNRAGRGRGRGRR
jgi:Protein of unknown function (DUF3223)